MKKKTINKTEDVLEVYTAPIWKYFFLHGTKDWLTYSVHFSRCGKEQNGFNKNILHSNKAD